jgi:hypothetical protein
MTNFLGAIQDGDKFVARVTAPSGADHCDPAGSLDSSEEEAVGSKML